MNLIADVHRALRSLLARPTFFLTAVATLALGLCSLAAIFTVYDAVLLTPLPYANADRIVEINRVQPPISSGPVSGPVFQEWRDRTTGAFDAFGGYGATTMNLSGVGNAERLTAYAATPGFWNVFSNPIALGRAFGDQEEANDERVVVLSNALWRNRFNAANDIVGRDILLNQTSYRVVGVAAADFSFPFDAQIWLPTYLPGTSKGRGGNNYLEVVARLRDGVNIAAASQTLATVTAWEAKTWPRNLTGLSARVQTLRNSLTGRFDQPMTMLLLASALVLLIACANLANLMLARGQERGREFAVRRALGADRRRIVRTVFAEAIVIGAVGALIGLLAAQPAVRILMSLAPNLLPTVAPPFVDARVVAVVMAAAFAALMMAGLAPAWRATRADPTEALRGSGRDVGDQRRQGRLRAALVSAEIALALTLLCGSALLIQSLRHLSEVDTGVDSAQVLTARIALPIPAMRPGENMMDWFERIRTANGPRIDAILARVAGMPGVTHAGLVDSLPISGGGVDNGSFGLVGHPIPDDQALVEFRAVSPDYFHTLGIPLRSGVELDAHDGHEGGLGSRVLVNQAFVDRYLPGSEPIGQEFEHVVDDTKKTIVGVVGNTRQFGLDQAARPEVYLPARAYPQGEWSLVIKTSGDALAFAEPLRRALHELAPDMPVFSVRTMDDATHATTAMRRFNLTLMSVFAGVAVLLSGIGLYGVIAYVVGQRRREIGLRQALGASGGAIHRLILGTGLRIVLPGIVVGVLGALALGRVIAAQLYGVGATNPLVLASVVLLLLVVALIACAIPTLRAARIPPMEALRDE